MSFAKLLWIDLEMTGLDPVDDRILEVAAVATDWDFNELATFEAVQKIEPDLINERMLNVAKDFWDANPVSRDALLAQNQHGDETEIVENGMLEFVAAHFEPDTKILLAGNSIHQDRKFIANEWPRLDRKLHYRMLDVSAWKVVFEGRYRKKFAKPEEHRALQDIRGSIMELQYYLKSVDKGLNK